MRKQLLTLVGIVMLVIGWSILLAHVPPKEIVTGLGVNNSLLVAFLVSALGGVSTITSANFYVFVVALATGGVSPAGIGVAAGAGITIGDSLFYYLGTQGHDVLSGRARRWADNIHTWVSNQHPGIVQVGAYIYTGLTPLPNDILTVSLGLAEYAYRRLLPALLLGNITLTIIVAEFAQRSALIQKVFGV